MGQCQKPRSILTRSHLVKAQTVPEGQKSSSVATKPMCLLKATSSALEMIYVTWVCSGRTKVGFSRLMNSPQISPPKKLHFEVWPPVLSVTYPFCSVVLKGLQYAMLNLDTSPHPIPIFEFINCTFQVYRFQSHPHCPFSSATNLRHGRGFPNSGQIHFGFGLPGKIENMERNERFKTCIDNGS